jgi:hypothetical protein
MLRQFLLNLKKNLPQHYVEAVPAESQKILPQNLKNKTVPTKSQKESNPKLHGGSSCQISKRICPKIMCRQFSPNLK